LLTAGREILFTIYFETDPQVSIDISAGIGKKLFADNLMDLLLKSR
jgi:hypothetical protein